MTVRGPGHMRSVRIAVSLVHTDANATAWSRRPTTTCTGSALDGVMPHAGADAAAEPPLPWRAARR